MLISQPENAILRAGNVRFPPNVLGDKVCFGLGAVINVFETRDGNTAPSQTPSFYLPCYKRLLVTRNSIEGKCGTTLARRWSKSAAVKFLPKLIVQRFGEPKEDFHLEVVNVN
jgi:hypothetical protein